MSNLCHGPPHRYAAGGLLFPYYVGVVHQLRCLGVLTDATPVAGASAGSLIATCSKMGLSHSQLVESTLRLADECRRQGTRHNLGPILQRALEAMLPDDAHERAVAGNVHVAVTRLLPTTRPMLLNRWAQACMHALVCKCTPCSLHMLTNKRAPNADKTQLRHPRRFDRRAAH
jgi:hypothetical protein